MCHVTVLQVQSYFNQQMSDNIEENLSKLLDLSPILFRQMSYLDGPD